MEAAAASLLRQYTGARALAEGRRLQQRLAAAAGLDRRSTLLGNLLIQMYGSCGCIDEAMDAFGRIESRNVFSWNILLMALIQNARIAAAEAAYDNAMPQIGLVAFNTMLAAMVETDRLGRAAGMFSDVPFRDVFSWTTLIAACSDARFASLAFHLMPAWTSTSWNALMQVHVVNSELQQAEQVFEAMPEPSVVSWNTMITVYARKGSLDEAKATFDRVSSRSSVTWTSMLAAFSEAGHFAETRQLFDRVPQWSIVAWNVLVQAHSEVGLHDEGTKLFSWYIPQRDVVSWNGMISAHARHGYAVQAKETFDKMPSRDARSWNGLIQAFVEAGWLKQAQEAFDEMPVKNLLAWTALALAYGQAGCADEAADLFFAMPQRNVISWNVMMQSLSQNGHISAVFDVFGRMPQHDTTSWNACSAAAAAATSGSSSQCYDIFARTPQRDVVSWNTLLAAYVEQEDVQAAQGAFGRMSYHDVVSGTSMITGYIQVGRLDPAAELFADMPHRTQVPWGAMLQGFMQAGQFDAARWYHDRMPKWNVVSWTSLITGYAQCGRIQDSRAFFNSAPEKDVITWNAMMSAYMVVEQPVEAYRIFCLMDLEGDVQPSFTTFMAVVDACAAIPSLEKGRLVHDCIGRNSDSAVEVALVDMYGKCGDVEQSWRVFSSSSSRLLPLWNSMLAAFAQRGHAREALDLFRVMQLEGQAPNEASFTNLFVACSHAGVVCFDLLKSVQQADYGVDIVASDLFVGLVDLLARSGQLQRAEELVSIEPNEVARTALLGACSSHCDPERGVRVARQMDSSNPAAYVLLSSIHRMQETR